MSEIKIIGCGGKGCNTIHRWSCRPLLPAALLAVHTYEPQLRVIHAPHKLLIGRKIANGLGTGSVPQIGEMAARENEDDLREFLRGSRISVIIAGLGGGTGTGSAPLLAEWSNQEGALTIGAITLPFSAEGPVRCSQARMGLNRIRRICDLTLISYNDKLVKLAPRMELAHLFLLADTTLKMVTEGIISMTSRKGFSKKAFHELFPRGTTIHLAVQAPRMRALPTAVRHFAF